MGALLWRVTLMSAPALRTMPGVTMVDDMAEAVVVVVVDLGCVVDLGSGGF